MNNGKNFFIPILIFFAALLVYSSFPSNQYTAVDGNLRCLPYMNATKWQLHWNHHMLYPVNVMLWSRVISLLFDVKPTNPFDFIRTIELMNSFFASIGVAMFFLILKRVTSNLTISILGSCALFFSHAFIVNAVNSNEPMIGFTVGLLSIIFAYLWVSSGRIFFAFFSALSLSLSALIYQSMSLIAPAIVVFVGLSSVKNGDTFVARNVFLYLFFTGISFFAIYFAAHWLVYGERSLQDIVQKIFFFNAFEIHGKLDTLKFFAAPFGLIYGFIYLDNMRDGVRAFFSEQPLNGAVLSAIALYMLTVVFFIALVYIAFKRFKYLETEKKIYLGTSIVGFASTLFAPLYWSLTYVKILMQPVAISIAFTALIFSETYKLPNKRLSVSFRLFIAFFLITMIFWNSNNVLLKMHFQPSNLGDAKELAERLDPDSLVILDWDSDIANLYSEFYKKPGQQVFCISHEMVMLKRDKARFIQELESEITSFKNNGKKVYFLGVLEKSRSKWHYFLEERLNIDYNLFDKYRRSAKFVKIYDKTSLYEH